MSDVRRDIIINKLVEMGFGKEDAKVALSKKEFRGVEDAMDWLISQQGKCPITWFFQYGAISIRDRPDLWSSWLLHYNPAGAGAEAKAESHQRFCFSQEDRG